MVYQEAAKRGEEAVSEALWYIRTIHDDAVQLKSGTSEGERAMRLAVRECPSPNTKNLA
jgi:hypothetical protein